MQTDYVSGQYVAVISTDGNEYECYTEFLIGLHCTARSTPGSFNYNDGGYPPEGAEFELTTIQVSVPKVNQNLDLTWNQFVALVGDEIAGSLYEAAVEEVSYSGDF